MIKQQIIDQLSKSITELSKNLPVDDLEKNVKAVLNASLSKLNLVTREEFDIQQKILLATRDKINQLEQQLNQLLNK